MPKTKSENFNTKHQQEKKLHQTLIEGIANEEILNIKCYSNEDLRKILDYQDKLLYETNNGTAFESIHENSISDLKKFASGQLSIDSDSYETMKEFIRIFGTNYKGELTPEGRAAQEKLNLLIEEKKQKILQHKAELRKQTTQEQPAAQELLNVVESIRQHKLKQLEEKKAEEKKHQQEEIPEFSFGMIEEEQPVKTVEYGFGMTDEPEPVNTAEYSFGISNDTEYVQPEEKKKQQIDDELIEMSAPVVPENKEKPETPAPLPLPPKENIVIEKNASDELLDMIINDSNDLSNEEIADILGEDKPRKKTTAAAPKKKQAAAPKTKTETQKKKQPVKRPGKRNFANKIKIWGIAAAVAFCSFLGLKNNKKEYQLDMPNPARTETNVTARTIPADSVHNVIAQTQTNEDLWTDVFEPERNTSKQETAAGSAHQLFPDVDSQTPVTGLNSKDELPNTNSISSVAVTASDDVDMQEDNIDLQYEMLRNKLISQRNNR